METHDLGFSLGADGTFRLRPGLVRIPDVSFVSWERLSTNELPDEPIPDMAPDLAVEVLNAGNTVREMDRKGGAYFQAGVRLVWLIDPKKRTETVYTRPGRKSRVPEDGSLRGGEVLPGFSLPLPSAVLFTRGAAAPRPLTRHIFSSDQSRGFK